MPENRRRRAAARIAAMGLLGLAWAVTNPPARAAEAYPDRPITLIIPTEAGGGMDVLGRLLGRRLAEILGQPVLVQNKPGGAGMIATNYVARAAPDGYTLLEGSIGTFAVAPSLYKNITYDPVKDFAAITRGAIVSNVLVVAQDVPVHTLDQLLALIRAHPGKFNNGLSNFGSAGHMASALFTQMTGVQMTNISYKGGEGAIADVAKGQVQMCFSTVVSALPLIKSGRVRPIAVTTPTRVALLPDIPTISEAGLPGFEATNWYSFHAPAHTPPAVIDKLNAAFRQALTDPAVVDAMRAQGMTPDPSTPQELQQYVESERTKWAKVVQDQHIQAQ